MMSLFVLLAIVLSCNAQQNYPFRNTSLSIEDRVKVGRVSSLDRFTSRTLIQDLVQRLTTDEMVLQMARGGAENNGASLFTVEEYIVYYILQVLLLQLIVLASRPISGALSVLVEMLGLDLLLLFHRLWEW